MNFTDTKLPEYLNNDLLPWMIWVKYKDEDCVACVNVEKSLACNRPIIDISYCMTKAHNGNIMFSVNFIEDHFKPSKLNDL